MRENKGQTPAVIRGCAPGRAGTGRKRESGNKMHLRIQKK